MASPEERIRAARIARKISQTELARRARISRQALGAIESGLYQPGVSVALSLARELGETVENLFGEAQREPLVADYIADSLHGASSRVALARIGGRLVAAPMPATCVALTPAGGIRGRTIRGKRVAVAAFRSSAEIDLTLVIAGCDPGVAILKDYLARHQPSIEVAVMPGSSHDALLAATRGAAHVAGVHLYDAKSGGYNLAAARAAFGGRRFRIINFARWELGLAMRPSGPPIKELVDLARPGVRLVNRAIGAGARAALDERLAAEGLTGEPIAGYDRCAAGHLEVAAAIAESSADAGVTLRFAAALYGLGFQPWREERYDLIVPETEFDSAPVRGLLDALNSGMLAREIGELCAYDTTEMGSVEAPFA